MKTEFKLTTLFHIPISINWSWFIVFGLITFSLAKGTFPATNPELDGYNHWLMAFIAALLFFASLLAHELAHSLVAIKNKLPINGITLFIFGGIAHLNKEPATPRVEFFMALAGPLMSFSLAIIFYTLSHLLRSWHLPNAAITIVDYLFFLNLGVGIFNLIPGFPLDGGRVLRALLWHFIHDLRKATEIASSLGKGFAYLLIGFGLFNLLNNSLLQGIWLIFIGLFLQEAADSSYRQVLFKRFLSGTKVADYLTRDVKTVPADINLNDLVDHYFFKHRHAAFPVVEDDQILGLVSLHDIKIVPKEKWATTQAKELVIPLQPEMVINERADVLTALPKLAASPVGRLLVIDKNKLIGILSQRDIMRVFEFKTEIGE
jgi:Zn-dependent protease/predicted transcriptional regulator